jgi:hypothetical protein
MTAGRPAAPPEPAPASVLAPVDMSGIGDLIGDKIRELFGLSDADASLVARIERQVTAQLLVELRDRQAGPARSDDEALRKIELLERRIAKLTGQLGMTEEQLQNVLRMKNIDPGVASIYAACRASASEQAHAQLKKEMMGKIFQANVELRKKLGVDRTPDPFPPDTDPGPAGPTGAKHERRARRAARTRPRRSTASSTWASTWAPRAPPSRPATACARRCLLRRLPQGRRQPQAAQEGRAVRRRGVEKRLSAELLPAARARRAECSEDDRRLRRQPARRRRT